MSAGSVASQPAIHSVPESERERECELVCKRPFALVLEPATAFALLTLTRRLLFLSRVPRPSTPFSILPTHTHSLAQWHRRCFRWCPRRA